jgi:hypothetical protein
MSLPASTMAGPAISFATGLVGAQNAQIWMASVLIGIEPDARAERRLSEAHLGEALVGTGFCRGDMSLLASTYET